MSVEFLSVAEGSLAYQRQVGDGARSGLIFLGGFASDMQGGKALYLSARCAEQGVSLLRFDYRGCGQSAGSFKDGTIGAWFEDTLTMFDRQTKGPQIVIGSSMGGWLGLKLAMARPERVRALIGIAAAPDFTEDLIWDKLNDRQRQTLLREGEIYEDDAPPDHRVPITLKLIEEARQQLVLRQPLPLPCPARFVQGLKDKEVPWTYAQRIAEHVAQDDVQVILVKNGDHRLSTPPDLQLIWRNVAAFL